MAATLPVVEPDGATETGAFSVCFRHVVNREVDQVLRYGRLSDLIVMARPGAESEAGLSAAFDAVLFDSGRAVLLVPAEPVTGFGATVAVAWDRSARPCSVRQKRPRPTSSSWAPTGTAGCARWCWAASRATSLATRPFRCLWCIDTPLAPAIAGSTGDPVLRCSDARRNAILRLNWSGAVSYSWRRTAKPPWYGPSAEPGRI